MEQNDNHADPSTPDELPSAKDAESSSDLPEHLPTEPIPIIDSDPEVGDASTSSDGAQDLSGESSGGRGENADSSDDDSAATGDAASVQRVSFKPHPETSSLSADHDTDSQAEVTQDLSSAATPASAAVETNEPAGQDFEPADSFETSAFAGGLGSGVRGVGEDPVGGNQSVARQPKKGKRAMIIAGVSVVVLACAYVGLAWFFSERVPADTSVAGVDISQLSRENAQDRLETELHDVMRDDITVTLGDTESSIDPTESGLEFDIPATINELIGFTLDPRRLIGNLFGVGAHEPVLRLNDAQMRSALNAISGDLNVSPVEGDITISDGEIEIKDPVDGVAINVDDAVVVVADEWLQGPRPVDLPDVAVPPTVDDDVIAHTQATLLDPLFSGGVPLTINEFSTEIPGEVVTKAASLHMVNDKFELTLDPEQIMDAVSELLPGLGESPEPARFEFRKGKVNLVPSVVGAGIDSESLTDVVTEAALEVGTERDAQLELETTESDFTTEDAEALKVTERVSHFTTPVPYDPVRTKNLVNGSKKINGTLIKPGETFSLIEVLGPIDADHGYVSSGVVVNGFESEAMGGGLSQISTTVFNAAFEAGMEDVSHTPHSRHFVRYPEGREATMFLPHLDMKWRNNAPYGVVVQAWIDDDAHVAMWSTKYWKTKITTGPRTRFTAPQKVYNPASNCVPESGGSSGFTVSVQRIVSRDGVRNDEYSRSYTHTYQPWNHVICGSKPKDPPPEKKSESNKSNDASDN